MINECKIEVRYAETDKMGVVYHANYLVWFEVGRTEFLKEINQPYEKFEEIGLVSPVLTAYIEYGEPLRYGDTAIVRTRLSAVTGVRSTFSYEVYKEGQIVGVDKPCCTGKTVHCFVNESDFKPLSCKRVAPDLYEAYLQVLESES